MWSRYPLTISWEFYLPLMSIMFVASDPTMKDFLIISQIKMFIVSWLLVAFMRPFESPRLVFESGNMSNPFPSQRFMFQEKSLHGNNTHKASLLSIITAFIPTDIQVLGKYIAIWCFSELVMENSWIALECWPEKISNQLLKKFMWETLWTLKVRIKSMETQVDKCFLTIDGFQYMKLFLH